MDSSSEVEKSITEQFKEVLAAIQEKNLSSHEEEKEISKLKVLSREKTIEFELVDPSFINQLVRLSKESQLEAQKCISNLIINYETVRGSFVTPYTRCAKERIQQHLHRRQEETSGGLTFYETLYFDIRIISLLSGWCASSRTLIADSLIDDLWELLEIETQNVTTARIPLINEILKSLFNLTLNGSRSKDIVVIKRVMTNLLPEAFAELDKINQREDKSDLLIDNLIHLLTNIKDDVYGDMLVEHSDRLLDYLNSRLESKLNMTELALLTPLINVCSTACKLNECIQKRYYERIFPSDIDFQKRPEEYDDLRGRLVKLMTHVDLMIKDAASEFLFCVCKNDVEKFITYTGFGNSVAFLTTNGLLGDMNNLKSCGQGRSNDQSTTTMKGFNPITGRYEPTKADPTRIMTDEERESSAAQLAEAITRLTNLGVVKPARIDAEGRITDLYPESLDKSSN